MMVDFLLDDLRDLLDYSLPFLGILDKLLGILYGLLSVSDPLPPITTSGLQSSKLG